MAESGISDDFEQSQPDGIKSSDLWDVGFSGSENTVNPQIDGRVAIEMYHDLFKLLQAQGVVIKKLSDSIARLDESIARLDESQQSLGNTIVSSLENRSQVRTNNQSNQGQVRTHHQEKEQEDDFLLSYEWMMISSMTKPCLVRTAFCWFRYQARKAYLKERKKFVESGKHEQVRILDTNFCETKIIMHVIIKCLRVYPVDLLMLKPKEIVPWQKALSKTVREALSELKQKLGLKKELTKKTLMKLFVTENFMQKEFPPGTPMEVQAFFNNEGHNARIWKKRRLDEEPEETTSNLTTLGMRSFHIVLVVASRKSESWMSQHELFGMESINIDTSWLHQV
eukprot:scaffold1390_cov138-Cylindrotheca_fusiformis.AAC.22